jgi:cell division initiation protein
MKISPTAIRQKAFETAFRGYDKKEVSLFLEEMSVIMEQINQENLDLRSKLQLVESEAKRLKDVEDSLFRTLKTAEDTGASIITEANEAAELIVNEANQFAKLSTDQANQYVDRVTKEADQYFQKAQKQADEQARIITAAAEAKAKETIKEIRDSMQSLVRSYEGLLDQREALVKSLKRLSQDALNQIDLSDAHFFRIDGKAYQRAVDELSRSSHFSVANIGILATQAIAPANVEAEEQFEADMSTATLEDDALETVEALQHELEDQGEIPVDEPLEDLEVQEEEGLVVDEILPEVEDEVSEDEAIEGQEEIDQEISMREIPENETEDPKPEELKKSSGSFFDQFD